MAMHVKLVKKPPFLALEWTVPPCTHVARTRLDLDAGVIEYVGRDNRKLAGTVGAVVGGLISASGLGMLGRGPWPWKLVSLAFAGAGAGFGALAYGYGQTENTITIRRGEGITARCQSPGTEPLVYPVALDAIADFEVIKQIVERTDRHTTTRTVDWRLDVIRRGAGPLRLALFGSEEQAREELGQIRAVLEI